MQKLPRIALLSCVLFISVGCDQVTKHVAKSHLSSRPTMSFFYDTFRLGYAENRGAFLSLGAGLPEGARFWLLTVMASIFLIILVGYTALRPNLTPVQVVAMSLLAGGGIGNLTDRLMRNGVVVDFMNLGIGPLRTGIFNVADLAIVAGMVLVLLPHKTVHEAAA